MDAESQLLKDLDQKIADQKQLITELCDALEEEYGEGINLDDRHPWNLIQRAREATK